MQHNTRHHSHIATQSRNRTTRTIIVSSTPSLSPCFTVRFGRLQERHRHGRHQWRRRALGPCPPLRAEEEAGAPRGNPLQTRAIPITDRCFQRASSGGLVPVHYITGCIIMLHAVSFVSAVTSSPLRSDTVGYRCVIV